MFDTQHEVVDIVTKVDLNCIISLNSQTHGNEATTIPVGFVIIFVCFPCYIALCVIGMQRKWALFGPTKQLVTFWFVWGANSGAG